ncbi:MAG: hypothetical protein ACRDH2_05820 [Anaerolineales bacterium]
MESFKKWFSLAVPAGWADIVVRAVKAAVVAFVVLHLKEYVDAGFPLDTPDITIDSLWIGGGSLVLNAILMWVKR